jgi:hypothetical protein
MGKDRISMEWLIAQDEQAWQASLIAPDQQEREAILPSPVTATSLEWRLIIGIVVLLLLLGGAWKRQSQFRLASMIANLEETMQSEYPQAVQLDKIRIQRERAITQVMVNYPLTEAEIAAYRETHFYRHSAAGWQRTEPDPDLMGPWQTLETEHFLFRFRAIDGQTVAEAAPRVELLYDRIRRDFGLPASGDGTAITVLVAADEMPDQPSSFTGRSIQVSSPALLSIPAEHTAASILHQSLVYPLTELVITEAEAQHPGSWLLGMRAWRPLIDALYLWILWEEGGPLAMGQQELVHWLYQNAQASPGQAEPHVPDAFADICRIYRVWKLRPVEVGIPLTCSEVGGSLRAKTLQSSLATRLGELFYATISNGEVIGNMSDTVALETVIAYSVATYGRDRLPVLLDALDEHATWQGLIPAVFGVSAAEFEAGWQSYLAQQYDMSLNH